MGRDLNNIREKLSAFFRYLSGQMSGRERNAFERNLQRDAFEEEAIKGYEKISRQQAENDITDLMSRLKRRTVGRRRAIWYRVAASVAVLMIISSVYFLIEKNRPQNNVSEIPVKVIPDSSILTPEIPVIAENNQSEKGTSGKQNIAEEKNTGPSKQEKEPVRENVQGANEARFDAVSAAGEARKDETLSRASRMTKTAITAKPAESGLLAKGRVISSEDSSPLPGVRVSVKGTNEQTVTDKSGNFDLKLGKSDTAMLVASFTGMKTKEFRAEPDSSIEVRLEPSPETISEIVTVGYKAKDGTEKGYTPPQPVAGKNAFDKYIRDSLRRPASLPIGQRVAVVLSLRVGSDGRLDSVNVVKSPSEDFSNEAIRLIRKGPGWKAAEIDGKPVDDEVRIRIVFR